LFYPLLADILVLLHFAFIVFAVCGGLLALRWRWAPWIHIPAVAWATFVEWSGRICPLTPLEQLLRRAGGGSNYSGGFIEHYVIPVIYPAQLTRETQLVLGIGLLSLNLITYWLVWRSRSADRSRRE
jgi:hypothetical protein